MYFPHCGHSVGCPILPTIPTRYRSSEIFRHFSASASADEYPWPFCIAPGVSHAVNNNVPECSNDGGDCYFDDDDESHEECPEEMMACIGDPECERCWEHADGDTCEDNGSTCSSLVDYFCCHIPDSCSENTHLVAYAGR